MKQIAVTIILVIAAFTMAVGQKNEKEEINFSDPLQIDSSEYFLIPKLFDVNNQQEYGKGKFYLPWGNYSDIFFYNAKTNQTKKLFNEKLAIIKPFNSASYSYNYTKEQRMPVNILDNHIVYLAVTDNFSGDNVLDANDPLYLFISTKTGDNLTQITPAGYNVISWTISKDRKMILVKVQNVNNRNKKFGEGDDELYYRIDLNNDISKILCYPISL